MSNNKNLDKNVEVGFQDKSSVSSKIENHERICKDVRCKICNSEHVKAIHDLKKAGHTYDVIVKTMRDKLRFDISPGSLSRHFSNYQKLQDVISARLINDDLIEEATCQAVHTKKLVKLIDQSFKMIEARIEKGLLYLTVSDLEKLMKLRYQVINGEDTDESNIMAIFQKASNKYGLNLQQGVLFKTNFTGQESGQNSE